MKTDHLLNRNDIAALLKTTNDVVRKNEKRLGIAAKFSPATRKGVKIVINRRNIVYRRKEAIAALVERGLLEPERVGI